jgi:hypothetical protein
MQFKANDGSMHPSQMKAYEAGQKPAAPAMPGGDPGQGQAQPKSIQDDPKAMGLVNQLQQMGYTGDDVEQAMMGAGQGAPGMDQGKEAAQAAPLQIPGM